MALELIYTAQIVLIAAAAGTAGFYYGRNRLNSEYEELLAVTEQELDELQAAYQHALLLKNQADKDVLVAQDVAMRAVTHSYEVGRKSVLEEIGKKSK